MMSRRRRDDAYGAYGAYGDFYSDYYGLDDDEVDRTRRSRRSHSSRAGVFAAPLRRGAAIVLAAVAVIRDIARHPRRLVAPGIAAFVLIGTLAVAVTAMPSGTGGDSGRTPASGELSEVTVGTAPIGDGMLNAESTSQPSTGTPATSPAGTPSAPGASDGIAPGQFGVDQPGVGGVDAAGPVTGPGTQDSAPPVATSTTADNGGGAPSQSTTADAPAPSSSASQPAPQPTPTSDSPAPPPPTSSSPAPSPSRSCSVVNPLPPYNCLVWAVS
jgi:hypothetical protein